MSSKFDHGSCEAMSCLLRVEAALVLVSHMFAQESHWKAHQEAVQSGRESYCLSLCFGQSGTPSRTSPRSKVCQALSQALARKVGKLPAPRGARKVFPADELLSAQAEGTVLRECGGHQALQRRASISLCEPRRRNCTHQAP